MKAITLYEPWASLVALNEKKIETRSWYTSYRGPLAIHAARKIPTWAQRLCREFSKLIGIEEYEGSWLYYLEHGVGPFGKIVATCNLVDCVRIQIINIKSEKTLNPYDLSEKEWAFGDYTRGRYAWILKDVHQLKEPIPCKGMQRLWNWDEAPHLVSIDPWVVGETKIWTPQGVRSGKKLEGPNEDGLEGPDEDAVEGLEVA